MTFTSAGRVWHPDGMRIRSGDPGLSRGQVGTQASCVPGSPGGMWAHSLLQVLRFGTGRRLSSHQALPPGRQKGEAHHPLRPAPRTVGAGARNGGQTARRR